jgi:hypothetical protein
MGRAVAAVAALALLTACSGSSDDSARPLATSAPVPSSEATTTSSSAPEATTTTLAPAGPDRCRGSAVSITFLESRAAAGHSLAVFEVRNPGNRRCRLTGHPAVEVLDPSGRLLATARRGAGAILGAAPPTEVTVGPGSAAYFGLESESVCPDDSPAADSDRVRVVLPGDTAPAEVAVALTVCPRPEILVSPIRASPAELAGE